MICGFGQHLIHAHSLLARLSAFKYTSKAIATQSVSIGEASKKVFDRESKYGAHNYHPLPVALAKGEGDVEISL